MEKYHESSDYAFIHQRGKEGVLFVYTRVIVSQVAAVKVPDVVRGYATVHTYCTVDSYRYALLHNDYVTSRALFYARYIAEK